MNQIIENLLIHNPILKHMINNILKMYDLDENMVRSMEFEQAKALLRRAVKYSQFYRELYAGINIDHINTIEDWNKLPVISKKDLVNKEKQIAKCSSFLYHRARTSGSTGMPLSIYYSYPGILKEQAYFYTAKEFHGNFKHGEPTVWIRGNLGVNKLFQIDKLSKKLYISSYSLNKQSIHKCYELIQEFSPTAIIGYPSSLQLMANLLFEQNLKLNVSYAFTSSETLLDWQVKQIENSFSARVYDWFACAERSIALEQCKYGKYHQPPGYAFFEKDTFQGRLVSTGLVEKNFPLIRYDLGEYLEPSPAMQCNCGRTIVCEKISGRMEDFLTLNDGSKIGRTDHLFKESTGIDFGQLVQYAKGEVNINIVKNELYSDSSEQNLIKKLDYYFGDKMKWRIRYIKQSELIFKKSGKFCMAVQMNSCQPHNKGKACSANNA